MTDSQFRFLTILLIVFTVSLSVVVPHIEFVLSVVGSTTGTTICFILPGMIFTRLQQKETTEKILARILTWIGIFILIVCTFSTLNTGQDYHDVHLTDVDLAARAAAAHPKIIDVKKTDSDGSGSGVGEVVKTKSEEEREQEAIRNKLKQEQETLELKRKQQELIEKLEETQKEQKHLIQEQKAFLKEIKKHEEEAAAVHAAVLSKVMNDTSEQVAKTNETSLGKQVKRDSVGNSSTGDEAVGVAPVPSIVLHPTSSTSTSTSRIPSKRLQKLKSDLNQVKIMKPTDKVKREGKSAKDSESYDF